MTVQQFRRKDRSRDDITCLLNRWGQEGNDVLAGLWSELAGDLKGISVKLWQEHLAGTGFGATMSATDLLHESFPKLMHYQIDRDFENRAQFFALVKSIMLFILLNYKRKKVRMERVHEAPIDDCLLDDPTAEFDLDTMIVLQQGLTKLGQIAPRQSRILQMRFYQDMTFQAIMSEMSLSRTAVYLDLKAGLVFLKHFLYQQPKVRRA